MCVGSGVERCGSRYQPQNRLREGSSATGGSGLSCRGGELADGHREASGRKSGRIVGVGRVHRQTSRPAPYVPFSTCRGEREWPNDRERRCAGSPRKGRHIPRCACRYGAAAGGYWRPYVGGAAVPVGVTDPAALSGGGASAVAGRGGPPE